MAKKSNIRSIRFSDDILEIIEAQEGETFTAKFESLIRKCYQDLPAKQTELTSIQESISYERKRLTRIRSKTQELDNAMYRMDTQLKSWAAQAKAATETVSRLIEDK